MRRAVVPLLLAVPLALAGCGADPAPGRDLADAPLATVPSGGPTAEFSASAPPGQWPSPEDVELVVLVQPGGGEPALGFDLSCHPVPAGGTADPAAICAHLEGLTDPFAPVPVDAVCTQVFGGGQTASVEGSWNGTPVDLELSRTDGCRIAQWDRLAPLLPVEVG